MLTGGTNHVSTHCALLLATLQGWRYEDAVPEERDALLLLLVEAWAAAAQDCQDAEAALRGVSGAVCEGVKN